MSNSQGTRNWIWGQGETLTGRAQRTCRRAGYGRIGTWNQWFSTDRSPTLSCKFTGVVVSTTEDLFGEEHSLICLHYVLANPLSAWNETVKKWEQAKTNATDAGQEEPHLWGIVRTKFEINSGLGDKFDCKDIFMLKDKGFFPGTFSYQGESTASQLLRSGSNPLIFLTGVFMAMLLL